MLLPILLVSLIILIIDQSLEYDQKLQKEIGYWYRNTVILAYK